MDLIKWKLNFVSCNFGSKSNILTFQIELALRSRSILKSRARLQTKLKSTQFNYHNLSLLIRARARHSRTYESRGGTSDIGLQTSDFSLQSLVVDLLRALGSSFYPVKLFFKSTILL